MQSMAAFAFAVIVALGPIPVVGLAWITNQLQRYLPAYVRGLASGLIPALLAVLYLLVVVALLRKLSMMSACPQRIDTYQP